MVLRPQRCRRLMAGGGDVRLLAGQLLPWRQLASLVGVSVRFQYGFRTSAITSTPLDPKYGAFKPLPRLACPAETPVRRQEIRCLITFITGFLAYAWFMVACVVGFHWCAAARATDTPALNLSMSRLLWWRQAFPEHWPPNILLEVLCLYVLSITLIWSGQTAGRAAALTPAQKQP